MIAKKQKLSEDLVQPHDYQQSLEFEDQSNPVEQQEDKPKAPSTMTQAQPTPMPSLSPVLATPTAQSAGASPQPTSAKILQSQS